MILFYTLTPDNRVLAIHQDIDGARSFSSGWRDLSGAGRIADRIASAERDGGAIYARSDRFKVGKALAFFAIAKEPTP